MEQVGGSLLREPLLHFLLIGALIFAVHAAVTPSVGKDRLIEVTPEVRQSIIDIFKRAHEQREPGPDELARLIDVWILNEITYREALAQGLDKGDEMIRERIMQKMRLLIFGNLKVTDPTEARAAGMVRGPPRALRHSRHHQLLRGADRRTRGRRRGTERSCSRSRRAASPRRCGCARTSSPSGRAIRLEQAFGKSFVDALAALPIGKWQTLQSPVGWHIVRVDCIRAGPEGRPGRGGDAGHRPDGRTSAGASCGTAAIRDLGKSYVIRRGEP